MIFNINIVFIDFNRHQKPTLIKTKTISGQCHGATFGSFTKL